MRFKDIAWAAFLNWYATGRDPKYVELFKNKPLINSLRDKPSSVNTNDFYQKIASSFLNSWGKMFIQEGTSREIHDAINKLNPYILAIRTDDLANCDLSNGSRVCGVIEEIYNRLSSIYGINMTGVSKIAHILNDSLFVLIDDAIQKKTPKIIRY